MNYEHLPLTLVDPVRDPVQDHIILAVDSDLNRLRLRRALYIHIIIPNVGLKIHGEHKHIPSEKTPLWNHCAPLKCLWKVCLLATSKLPTVTQSHVNITNHLHVQAYQFVPYRSPGKVLDFMRNVRCEKFAEMKSKKTKMASLSL